MWGESHGKCVNFFAVHKFGNCGFYLWKQLSSIDFPFHFITIFQLVEKLSAKAPDGQRKIKILTAIAEEHNIKWDPKSFGDNINPPADLLVNFSFHKNDFLYCSR